VIAELKSYPAMKDSGVPSLGYVPEHWGVRRLRTVADMRVSNIDKHSNDNEQTVRLCNYVDVYKHDRISTHMPFMRATASMPEIARFRLAVGDVLITKDSESWNDIGVPAHVVESAEDLVCGYHLALLRSVPELLTGAYLFRAVQSEGVAHQLHIKANGVTRFGLSHSAIKSTWVPTPPLNDQAAIVRFLDYADGRIRQYIHAKQQLIKLLEEQKQVIIHRAVTRGLNPDVPFKPSGVECLGDVPEHWEVLRGKYVFDPVDVRSVTGSEELLTVSSRHGIVPRASREVSMFMAASYVGHKLCWPEDLVINSLWAWAGGFGFSRHHGIVSTAYGVYRPRKQFSGLWQYLDLALRSGAYDWQFHVRSKGIWKSRLQLTDPAFLDMPVVLPPEGEATAICERVGAETAEIEEAVAKAEREISLLGEYRTRLIADVVTGKLDVREAAAGLPDELELIDEADLEEVIGDELADDLDTELEEVEA